MEGREEVVVVDQELKKKIKDTVTKILKRSNLCDVTELKAREEASSELDLDLSQAPYKRIVSLAVESFIKKALMTIESEMGKRHNQIVKDVEGAGTETAKKKKKKKKKNKDKEVSSDA